ncbi:helix-turn-helix domain-containing protein [Cohaesibacter celericrescens]|uniref:Uncharacterized protein n=1 Tax=Cohaesibacter celericrescens TaxID=2067669 RepID=A0A2N5XTN5_9HYPH|nr:helix-turn-helix transcriptional regulator [Cohaesibacter celericrescens]PLW77872.1 hypothetical protein C0081_07030 [Cohaesibacter celericrescens]
MKYPTFIRRRSAIKDTLLCAHDAILRDRLADFLRDQHPTNTAKEVARKARIPHRTVERWLSGLSSPRLEHFISLLHAYGPALLQAAMDDASIRDMNRMGFDWVERLRTAEDQDAAKADLKRVADALKALTNARPNNRPVSENEGR